MATVSKARKQFEKMRVFVSVDKARDQIGALVNRAAAGDERFIVTRHGLPAAAIVSIDDLKRLEEGEAA